MPHKFEMPKRAAPRLSRVTQALSTEHIANPENDVRQKILASGFLRKLKKGGRIAITAGSRGIGGFVPLLRGICEAVRQVGGEPWITPSMGSHGGATAEGQTELLRRLGVTEDAVPAPIRATMRTRQLDKCPTGAVAHLDEAAFEADGVIVLGRVKTHPENRDRIASGLLKMVTVGLGKQIGAQEAHSHGLWPSVEAVPKVTMASAKILLGVAVVENAFREPVAIEVVPGTYDAFREADERLLNKAKEHFVGLPFKFLDLLIVDEFGKNISGTGMDLNVIGKWRAMGGTPEPNFHRIVALSLTRESGGNGLGIGLADFTTRRVLEEYDPIATYVNLLTATEPGGTTREGPLPLGLNSDREAIEVAMYSTLASEKPKVCRIRNTSLLHEFWVSEALLPELERDSRFRILEKSAPLSFDAEGNL